MATTTFPLIRASLVSTIEAVAPLRMAEVVFRSLQHLDDGEIAAMVEYLEIPLQGDLKPVLADRSMPGARWFPGAQLNYARQALRQCHRLGLQVGGGHHAVDEAPGAGSFGIEEVARQREFLGPADPDHPRQLLPAL